jgi:hypothetical protein
LDVIFVCKIDGMKYPVGFTIITEVFGLNVKYEILEPAQNHSITKGNSKKMDIIEV